MSVPSWVRDAIFYLVFPDRFARSKNAPSVPKLEPWDAPPTRHGYKGGDLLGIVEHLDWLEALGVSALCLTPIFRATANHRYHTHDFFAVDPLLGGERGFDALLDACHARGMRVVIDGVFDHVGRGFHPFVDVAENGAESPYTGWFKLQRLPIAPYSSDPGYDAWAGVASLPKLDTDNPEVREYLMQVGEHWARRGIDGWRLDTPAEVATPGFWQELRQRVKAVNPELYLVGEVWDDASEWLRGDRFDGTMNYWYPGHVLAFVGGEALDLELYRNMDYPVKHALDARGLADFVERLLALYPREHLEASLVLDSSHDAPRLRTALRGDFARVRLQRLLELTFPGAPTLYYGEEIGLEGGCDPACRGGFPWDRADLDDNPWISLHRSLTRLRRDHVALRRGGLRVVHAEGQCFAFEREHASETLLVAVNAGDAPASVDVPDGAELVFGESELAPLTGAVWKIG